MRWFNPISLTCAALFSWAATQSALAEPVTLSGDCLPKKTFCSETSAAQFTATLLPERLDDTNVFGLTVMITDSRAFIGAPWDSAEAYRAGAVYVFEHQEAEGTWALSATLRAPEAQSRALFGSSLDYHKGQLLIGAPGEREKKLISAGASYIYQYDATEKTWKQASRMTSDDIMAGDFYGTAVTWIDENNAAIGAHLEDGAGVDSGAVYLMTRADTGWMQSGKLQPDSIKTGTLFGNAIDAENNFLAVGAYGHDGISPGGGAVYIFEYRDNSWQEKQLLQGTQNKAFSEFGWTLDLEGDTLAIGAPYEDESQTQAGSTYIYELDPATRTFAQTARLLQPDAVWHERFGASVSLSDERLLVGAPYGVAYLFKKGQDDWVYETALVGNYPYSDNLFGRTVALNKDKALLGVPSRARSKDPSGGAYLFTLSEKQ